MNRPLWTRRAHTLIVLTVTLIASLTLPIALQLAIWIPALTVAFGAVWPARNDTERREQDARLDEWIQARQHQRTQARQWRHPADQLRTLRTRRRPPTD